MAIHALPPLPDPHGLAVLALIIVAFALFALERLPLETSCLLILAALVLGFQVFPYEAGGRALAPAEFFYGFGHEALVAVCALMIIGQGLETTGALRPVAAMLARLWAVAPAFSLLLTLAIAAALSAFVNNTPVVVLLLPILVGVSMRGGLPASSVLMPMGFATLVGGMATTIGTSTNLLVVSIAADLGMQRFHMFDFALPAVIAGTVALAYLWLIAPRLLPARVPPLKDASPRVFEAVLHVTEDSAANGMTLSEAREKTAGKMRIEAVERGPGLLLSRLPTAKLQAGDRLRVRDTPENLKEFEQQLGAQLHNIGEGGHRVSEEHPLSAEDQQLAEVVVTESSLLHGRTLSEARFADYHDLIVLAIHRSGPSRPPSEDISQIRLARGDVLLVQGAAKRIAELKRSGRLLVLDGKVDLPEMKKVPLALAITAAVILAAALGAAPIEVSAVTGVALMLITRCLVWEDVKAALSVQVIMIVVASLALGVALMRTGGADYVAQLYVALAGGLPPAAVMSGLMLVMAVLTNIVSNNAAAVIGTPIAVNIAQAVGAPPEPFVLAVLFGANLSFATPMAYKTNLLVFAAGGYRFSDFVRAGVPLTIIMWLALSAALAAFYRP
ncbi:MAG TPA: SLC13 family permease [Burkholderiales bacterium]|nr:SLC13 family permease [Burkholderiales bacterium]